MRFVLLGDLHYSAYSDKTHRELREEFFNRLFQSVKDLRPDAVIAIGDTTDDGLPGEFEGLHANAARNGVSFVTVNGNHDVLALSKQELAFYTGNRFPYFTLYFNPLTGLSEVTDPNAARFLILDTPKEKNARDHGGFVNSAQFAWLTNQVLESGNAPLFVFGHHPLTGATRYSNFPMLAIDNSKEVWQALSAKRLGKCFYFCGHNHANSIARRGNWHFIQTAAPLRTSDFRLIEFTSEKVSLQMMPIQGGQETALLGHRLADAMGDFKRFPSKGFRGDRELVTELVPYNKVKAIFRNVS